MKEMSDSQLKVDHPTIEILRESKHRIERELR